jgi:hypothetical protein
LRSIARTLNRWSPGASPLNVTPGEHRAGAAPSKAHSKLDREADELNENVAVVAVVREPSAQP